MTTALIKAGAASGAMGAFLSGRPYTDGSPTATEYATAAAAADAFSDQCLTANAALSVPMADADNASLATLLAQCAAGILEGRQIQSAVATDYATEAAATVAAAKAAVPSLA